MVSCQKPNLEKANEFVEALKEGGVDFKKMESVMTESCSMSNTRG